MGVENKLDLFNGIVEGKLFALRAKPVSLVGHSSPPSITLMKASVFDHLEFHRQAGHPSSEALKKMFNVEFSMMDCDSCHLSKSHHLPFSSTLPPPKGLLDFIYMDLSGKITPPSIGGGLYYLKITDAFSSFKYVYILSEKSQALEKFKKYCNIIENLLNTKIKKVVTDGGGKFCLHEFENFYLSKGIRHRVSARESVIMCYGTLHPPTELYS